MRQHRVPFELCFVVDNSYSLHADRLVEKVKGLAFGLLEDATARGDRVSLVAFRSGVAEATVALRPTGSVRVASTALRAIPLSGRTPLPHALLLAGRLLRQELRKRRNARPFLVVVSDGLPNVPLRRGGDPLADVLAEARALRRSGIGLVVVDATPPDRPTAGNCAEALADCRRRLAGASPRAVAVRVRGAAGEGLVSATMLSQAQAAALEALLDEGLGVLPAGAVADDLVEELRADGLLEPARRDALLAELEARAVARPLEWAAVTVTQGELLAAFTTHCAEELDDVEVVSAAPAELVVRWRDETSTFLVRNGVVGVERRAGGAPLMVIAELGDADDRLVQAYLADASLRGSVAVCDLARLERIGAVRSSAFVYFEWFLRDAYGVKLLPSAAFTAGLIDRGILSLGMG